MAAERSRTVFAPHRLWTLAQPPASRARRARRACSAGTLERFGYRNSDRARLCIAHRIGGESSQTAAQEAALVGHVVDDQIGSPGLVLHTDAQIDLRKVGQFRSRGRWREEKVPNTAACVTYRSTHGAHHARRNREFLL